MCDETLERTFKAVAGEPVDDLEDLIGTLRIRDEDLQRCPCTAPLNRSWWYPVLVIHGSPPRYVMPPAAGLSAAWRISRHPLSAAVAAAVRCEQRRVRTTVRRGRSHTWRRSETQRSSQPMPSRDPPSDRRGGKSAQKPRARM